MSRYFKAEITENIPLNRNYNLLSLKVTSDMFEPFPGQFFMVEVHNGYDPLLKRPFSIFRRSKEGFQILYRIQGRGTNLLSRLKRGTLINILGPLGIPYPLISQEKTPLIVAGGIGIASVFSLIERYSKRAYVFYGARTSEDLFMLDEIKSLCKELFIATDDGSRGEKGSVIRLIYDFLDCNMLPVTYYQLFSCGPHLMLKEIANISFKEKIKAFVSLEANMACGIGACIGCVVKTYDGYKRVCKEGPVFDVQEIIW